MKRLAPALSGRPPLAKKDSGLANRPQWAPRLVASFNVCGRTTLEEHVSDHRFGDTGCRPVWG
jgi:hypothetical protein